MTNRVETCLYERGNVWYHWHLTQKMNTLKKW